MRRHAILPLALCVVLLAGCQLSPRWRLATAEGTYAVAVESITIGLDAGWIDAEEGTKLEPWVLAGDKWLDFMKEHVDDPPRFKGAEAELDQVMDGLIAGKEAARDGPSDTVSPGDDPL